MRLTRFCKNTARAVIRVCVGSIGSGCLLLGVVAKALVAPLLLLHGACKQLENVPGLAWECSSSDSDSDYVPSDTDSPDTALSSESCDSPKLPMIDSSTQTADFYPIDPTDYFSLPSSAPEGPAFVSRQSRPSTGVRPPRLPSQEFISSSTSPSPVTVRRSRAVIRPRSLRAAAARFSRPTPRRSPRLRHRSISRNSQHLSHGRALPSIFVDAPTASVRPDVSMVSALRRLR